MFIVQLTQHLAFTQFSLTLISELTDSFSAYSEELADLCEFLPLEVVQADHIAVRLTQSLDLRADNVRDIIALNLCNEIGAMLVLLQVDESAVLVLVADRLIKTCTVIQRLIPACLAA